MVKLFISEPGSSEYQVLEPSEDGSLNFEWVSFSGKESLSLKMKPASDESFAPDYALTTPYLTQPDSESYKRLVRTAVHEIQQKALGKIVLSRPQSFPIRVRPVKIFKALCAKYPRACVYLFSHPRAGVWMGASPEILLRKDGDQVQSMSLAGTRKAGEEHSFTAKEGEEQELVTEFIAAQFKLQNQLTAIKITGPDVVSAGNLAHLQSIISATSGAGFKPKDLLQSLHPTPAVSGFPRKEALDFISQYESYDRSYYAGYFGLKEPRGFRYYVNLRCMQLFEDSVVLYAGGGITKDSDATAEWEETESKMRTLLDVMEA